MLAAYRALVQIPSMSQVLSSEQFSQLTDRIPNTQKTSNNQQGAKSSWNSGMSNSRKYQSREVAVKGWSLDYSLIVTWNGVREQILGHTPDVLNWKL